MWGGKGMKYKKRIISVIIICLCLIAIWFYLYQQPDQQKLDDVVWDEEVIDEVWESETDYQKTKKTSYQEMTEEEYIKIIKEEIQKEKLIFYTYEDVYVYFDMLEDKKQELYQKVLAIFLMANPKQLYHKGYAVYLGNLGKDLIRECQRFRSVKYAGEGDRTLENHIFQYHYFYGANESYYMIGSALFHLEKALNWEDYGAADDNIKTVHENIKIIEEMNNEDRK